MTYRTALLTCAMQHIMCGGVMEKERPGISSRREAVENGGKQWYDLLGQYSAALSGGYTWVPSNGAGGVILNGSSGSATTKLLVPQSFTIAAWVASTHLEDQALAKLLSERPVRAQDGR